MVIERSVEPADDTSPRFLLPAHSYYDPAWHEREQRLIFGANYSLVGYESDIPRAGDYLVAKAGLEPVVVVRRADGGLAAMSNICRHRGMVVALENGHADKHLRCVYHGWEYGPTGTLERVPQRRAQFPDLVLDDYPLLPMSVGSWAGMIFVHPAPDAPSLEEWLGDYVDPAHVGAFPWAELADIKRYKVPLACNWKLYIENHIDIYHLWYLHDSTLGMYDHHALEAWKSGLHWGCAEPLRPDGERRRRLEPIPGVAPEERRILRANLIFPNVPMTTSETTVMTYQVVPTGPETCYLDIRVRGAEGAEIHDDGDVLTVLRDEDGLACEQMQAAIRSSSFAVGPLAKTHELPIMQFHQDVLSFLE